MTAPRSHGASQAHQPVPEPRWRMWTGTLAELACLLLLIALGLAVTGLGR